MAPRRPFRARPRAAPLLLAATLATASLPPLAGAADAPPGGGSRVAAGVDAGVDVGAARADARVDLNRAPATELAERLPGIGPAKAAAIVAHREAHGPFASVDALLAVRGIGPRTLARLSPLVGLGAAAERRLAAAERRTRDALARTLDAVRAGRGEPGGPRP